MFCCCGDVRETLLLVREQGRKIDEILAALTDETKLAELAAKLRASQEALSKAVDANAKPVISPVKL